MPGNELNRIRQPKTEKKRKLTYAERMVAIGEEITLLQSGVAVLKTRGLPPQSRLQNDPILLPVVEEHARLLCAIEDQQLRVAKMQSALSRCLINNQQQHYPLYTRICLTRDWDERRPTLLSIREQKLHSAMEFLMAAPADPSKSQFSEHKFETDEGDLCCVRSETVEFRGVGSLRQVFDALSFYTTNMEIITSEVLGHLTLRDDYDTIDGKAFHSRFLTTNESGVTTEGNIVSFRHLFDEKDQKYDGDPCGVFVVDFIDEDELYPYVPSERVRRDASGAIVLTAKRLLKCDGRKTSTSAEANGDAGDELIVTMRRAAFLKLHHPQFSMSAFELQELHDDTMKWADVMLKTVRGMVYAAP